MDYKSVAPILDPIPADRQGARRHYGVHPYFTRRPYNVVREYVLRYSAEGDVVLDPFGGSGVTAIEAFLENRTGIQSDLNPLANFIASGIADLAKGKYGEYSRALEFLEGTCAQRLHEISGLEERKLKALLKKTQLPENVRLPSNADVSQLFDLFEPRQLAALGYLRSEIWKVHNKYARNAMLLALSATIAKVNQTFLSAQGRAASRGGSSIFSIYRYKVAKQPVSLPVWETFRERAINVLNAKAEIEKVIEAKRRWRGRFECREEDILSLRDKLKGRVDYIFTDPPYGGHIAYLDLSTMWNAWLDKVPSRRAISQEVIVGGDAEHSEELYVHRLGESIAACVDMLKKQRWMSAALEHRILQRDSGFSSETRRRASRGGVPGRRSNMVDA